jgi:predicted lipoprotein with Yx(FWY)xxD motif
MFLKRTFYITIGLLMVMFIAACGTTTTGSSSNSTPGTTATSGQTSAVVKTATATVKGKSETILTNANGMTLYYFTPDTATASACTGGCASTWPPLLSTGSGSPTSANSLPGTLAVLSDANGNQVTYNGHLLYVYSGDSAPGQTNGEGLFGKWFVAAPDLSVLGGTQPKSTPTSGGYGY